MYEIEHLTQNDFPPQLMEIPQPPKRLSLRGVLPPADSIYLSVVGSRKYTSYGKEVCEKIISELAGTDIVIVSGLALGIDAIAHQAAIKAGLTTLAIPGSGLESDVLYPATNRALARKILDSGGALISPFEDDARAAPYTFPQRNRLMAGISRGTLVIEATEKSGTIITARLTTEYNKDLFAVPHSIFSHSGVGPNRLIKAGAIPTTSGKDILDQWNLIDSELGEKQASILLTSCSDVEKNILNILVEPMTKDRLIGRVDISVQEMNILLSTMEIKGLINERMGEIRRSLSVT